MKEKPSRISAEDLSAYERWELPTLDGGDSGRGNRSARQQKLRPPTAEDLENIRKSAYEEGFAEGKKDGMKAGQAEGLTEGREEGRKQGLEQGLKDAQTQVDAQLKSLSEIMQALSEPMALEQSQLEEAMLNVSLAVARSVIHRELQVNSDVIKRLIHELLQTLPKNSANIRFRVNPQDHELVVEALQQSGSGAEVSRDESISRGGCIVDTATQQLDYTVARRFQKTVHTMLSRATENAESGPAIETPDTIEKMSDYPDQTLEEAEQESQAQSPDTEETQPEDQNEKPGR